MNNIIDEIKKRRTLLARIQFTLERINDSGKIPKLADYSTLSRTTIDRYVKGRHRMRPANTGLLIMALIRLLREECGDEQDYHSLSIETFCTGLEQEEYNKIWRVAGEDDLIKEVSQKIPLLAPENYADFENEDYAFYLIRQWETKTIGERDLKDVYLPLRLKDSETTADEMLEQWLRNPDEAGFILLLGDIGIGKTTTLLHFAAQQAERYINNPRHEPLPFYIDLKRYREVTDIQTLMESILFNHFKDKIVDMDHLLRLVANGRIVFVLDAFDEMAIRFSQNKLHEHLVQIERLFHETGKLILSSRKQAFADRREVIDLFNQTKLKLVDDETGGNQLELDGFRIENDHINDVRAYLRKYFGETAYQTPLKMLEGLKGYSEMSRHPLMLEIMVQIVPQLKDLTNLEKADIFSIYYKNWCLRKRDRRIIDAENLKRFCQILAGSLWQADAPQMSYTKLKEEVKKHFNPEDPQEFDNLTRAISNDSFLTRDGDTWAFMHESFFHYFLALAIADRDSHKKILEYKPLNQNVLEFFKGLKIESGLLAEQYTDILAQGGSLSNLHKNLLTNCRAILRIKGFKDHFMDHLTPELLKKTKPVEGMLEMANEVLNLVEAGPIIRLSDIVNAFIAVQTKFGESTGITSEQIQKTFMMLAEFQAGKKPGETNPAVDYNEFGRIAEEDLEMGRFKGLLPFLRNCSAIIKMDDVSAAPPSLSFAKDFLFHYFLAGAIYDRIKNDRVEGLGATPVPSAMLDWFVDIAPEKDMETALAKTLIKYMKKAGDEAWRAITGKYIGSICLSIYSRAGLDLTAFPLTGGFFPNSHLKDGEFSGLDMTGINLSNSDLSNIDLRDAILGNANLIGADFSGASLTRANCHDADLSYAIFSGAFLNYVNFTGCNLSGADFSQVASKNEIVIEQAITINAKGL